MKKHLKSSAATSLLFALALTGCGGDATPGNLAAYQQGSNKCSDQFIQDGTQLEVDVETALISSDVDGAQKVINDFGTKYKDVNCKVEYEGQSQMIDVNDFVSRASAELVQFREQHPSNTNSSGAALTSAPASGPVYDHSAQPANSSELFKNGVTLQINDPSAFSPANIQSIGTRSIQNGKLMDSWEINEDADSCEITYYRQDPELHAGSKIKLELAVATRAYLQFYPANFSFVLRCHKDGVFAEADKFTLENMNQVLSGLATASINQ